MSKLSPLFKSIFYVLTSALMLYGSFASGTSRIFLNNFNQYGIDNKVVIVYLTIASLFILLCLVLSTIEIYRMIRKKKSIDAFSIFIFGFTLTLISFITLYYYSTYDYLSAIFVLLVPIFVCLPYLIKSYDKKDILYLPKVLYVLSYLGILFAEIRYSSLLISHAYKDVEVIDAEIITLRVFAPIAIITLVYTVFYLTYRFIKEDYER